jgi:hypothetical protein
MKDKILDYAMAMVNLYGIADCNKILEVYKLYHPTTMGAEDLKKIFSEQSNFLRDHYIEMIEGHLISAEVKVFSDIKKEQEEKLDKPYYLPEAKELLRYRKRSYFEVSDSYKALEDFLKTRVGCLKSCRKLARAISLRCKSLDFHDKLESYLEEKNLKLKDPLDQEVFNKLVKDLEMNTRKWSNNGYTLKELESMEA